MRIFTEKRRNPPKFAYYQWFTKNPRRELILTGINANYLKLEYGAFSLPSTMLILKQAENRQKMGIFFLVEAAMKRQKLIVLFFPKRQ